MDLKVFFVSLTVLVSYQAQAADILKPFKDDMFKYERIMETRDGGAWIRAYYDEMKHVNGRDEIPVKKALNERVDINPRIEKRDIIVRHPKGDMETFEVGNTDKPKIGVIYIHGASELVKHLGVNDWSFGGNFNRLKNMVVDAGGVYYSPTVSFDEAGASGVAQIVASIKKKNPDAKVVVACGSAGSDICWRLASDKDAVANLSGLVLTGGASVHSDIANSPAHQARLPMVIAHGSRDNYKTFEAGYQAMKKDVPDYPARFILFDQGGHGTPIRMIDWRETLNWIFNQTPSVAVTPGIITPPLTSSQPITTPVKK